MKKEVKVQVVIFLVLLVSVASLVLAHHKEGHEGGGGTTTSSTTGGGDGTTTSSTTTGGTTTSSTTTGGTDGTTTSTSGTTTTTGGDGGPTPVKVVPENPKDGDTIKRGVLTILVKGFRGKHLDSDLKITVESELFGTIELTESFRDKLGRYVANAANVTIGKDVEKGEYAIVIKGDKGGAYDEERILITLDPTIYITTSLGKEEYFKGERMVFAGDMAYFDQGPVKNVTTQLTVSAEDFLLNKTIRTDLDGKFIDSYLISFAEPDGVWDIKIHATDDDGNEGSADLTTIVSTPEGVAFYTVTFLSPLKDGEYKRGSSIPITVEVKDEGKPLEGAIVDFKVPRGEIQMLEEIRPGTYTSEYQTSPDEPLGLWYISVQAIKTKDDVTKAGGRRIPITIRPASLSLTLSKPTTTDFFTGQKINIEASLSYTDATIVENADVTLKIGQETIKLAERKPGIYTSSYLFTQEDVDLQSLQLDASDIYGNSVILPRKAISVEAIGNFEFKARVFYHNVLLRYGYAILVGLIVLVIVTRPVWYRAHLKSSLKKSIEDEKRTFEMQKDTQRKYFKHHSLSRDDYDKLMLKYRERMSDLKEKKLKSQNKLGKGEQEK